MKGSVIILALVIANVVSETNHCQHKTSKETCVGASPSQGVSGQCCWLSTAQGAGCVLDRIGESRNSSSTSGSLVCASSVSDRKRLPCFLKGLYYASANALAVGMGDLNSAAVCKYQDGGDPTQINSVCPELCKGLISATWGSCYCSSPGYKPVGGEGPIRGMTVQQMFMDIAGASAPGFNPATGFNCREWMGLTANRKMWNCN